MRANDVVYARYLNLVRKMHFQPFDCSKLVKMYMIYSKRDFVARGGFCSDFIFSKHIRTTSTSSAANLSKTIIRFLYRYAGSKETFTGSGSFSHIWGRP